MQRYIAGSAPGTPCTISCCPRLSRTQRNQYNAAAALAWTTRRRTESIQSLLATIVLFLAFMSVPPIWQPPFDAYLPPVPDHSSSFAAARVPSLDIDWYVQAPELRVASCSLENRGTRLKFSQHKLVGGVPILLTEKCRLKSCRTRLASKFQLAAQPFDYDSLRCWASYITEVTQWHLWQKLSLSTQDMGLGPFTGLVHFSA